MTKKFQTQQYLKQNSKFNKTQFVEIYQAKLKVSVNSNWVYYYP